MFKKLYLNPNFQFDHLGNFLTKDGSVPLSEEGTDRIYIEIYGKATWISKKILGLLCHFEVKFDLSFLDQIYFVPCKSKILNMRCGMLMYFHNQIHLDNGFYAIPGYTNFGITKTGVVRASKSKRVLKQSIGPYGYPQVPIRDADKSTWRNVAIHILLAKTFVRNSDPENRLFVNHKDGNKLNYSIENLEWVTSRENSDHAIEEGLRNDNRVCKLKDHKTDKIYIFASIARMLKEIGYKVHTTPIRTRRGNEVIPRLLKGRYEVKYIDDLTDWKYSVIDCDTCLPKLTGPFEARHIESGKIEIFNSIKDLSYFLKASRETTDKVLKREKLRSINGYLIRVKSDLSWPTEYENIVYHKARKFTLTNIYSKEIKHFNSRRSLCKYLNIDKQTLNNRLKDKKLVDNWSIEEIN